ESSLRFRMLALLAERDRRLEGRTRLGGLPGLPPIVGAPARHREDDQDRRGDDVDLIALPQLLELLAPDFLVDFLKDIGHSCALALARQRPTPGRAVGPLEVTPGPPAPPNRQGRTLSRWRPQ